MTSRNFKQSMVNQDQEIIFEVVKVSGSWVFPAASSIVEATRGKNMYLRLTDDGRSDIFRLDSVKDGENAGETVFGFVGNGGMDLVELTATTDGTGATTGSWDYEPGEGPAGEAIGNLGQPLQWKGPATVTQLNTGITGIQPGWTYTLTDAGTLTDGSIAVEAGDEVAWTEDGEWFQVGPSLVELKADVVQAKSDIADIQDVVPEEASESNKLVTKDELDNVQESIQSGFTPKGEISVSDLNDLTTQSNGDQYILTDSGTITDGSVTVEAGDSVAWNSTDSVWYKVNQYALSKYGTDVIKNLPTSITAFRTGDVIPVDGPSGTAKMSKDDLLRETTQNALAGNVAPAFDETGTTTYLAGTPVSRGGKTYVFKVDHSGAWNASDVVQVPSSEAVLKVCRSKIIQTNYIPSSLDDLKESFVYIIQRTTGLTTTGFPADAPAEGIFKLSVIKSYSSASEYQVEQELKMVLDTSKIWRRVYNTSGSSWSAWTISNFALNVENKQIMANWNKNLANLNDAPINSIIRLTITSETTTLNIPSDFLKDSANNGELRTYKCYYSNSNYRIYQELTRDEDNAVWRRMFQSSWRVWTKIELGYISQAPVAIFHNLATNPSDLNNLTEIKCYVVQLTSSSEVSNFPTNYPEGGIGILSVYKAGINATTPNVKYQIVQRLEHFTSGKKWFRKYSTVTSDWSAWKEDTGLSVSENQIMASWNKNLANLNDAPINSLLRLTITSATTTLNIPSDFLKDSVNNGELTTCKCYYSDSNYRIYQNLTRESDGAVWYRLLQSNIGTWGPWNKRAVLENIVTIGTGKQYETLREGITAAYDIPNCKVLVYPKVYDLAVECSDILSETMTENFTPCPLGNGMHIIFFDGAYVKANIDQGDMSALDFHYVQEHFEPFGSRVGSFTIENLNLESRNTRYGVHDDHGSAVPCVRKFINCHMVRTAGNTAFTQNIGGGLSGHETVVIEGGTYKTIPSSGNPKLNEGDIDYCQNVIGYHNATAADSDNSITVKDVLFEDKGFLDILSYGASTILSRVYVSNCRYCYPPLLRYSFQDNHDNIEITALWNNEQLVAGEWVVNPDDKSEATFVPGN